MPSKVQLLEINGENMLMIGFEHFVKTFGFTPKTIYSFGNKFFINTMIAAGA